jgi:hypothetical protein
MFRTRFESLESRQMLSASAEGFHQTARPLVVLPDQGLVAVEFADTDGDGLITFYDARPRSASAPAAKWTGPEFDASKNEVSIETLEVAHEGLSSTRTSGAAAADAAFSRLGGEVVSAVRPLAPIRMATNCS